MSKDIDVVDWLKKNNERFVDFHFENNGIKIQLWSEDYQVVSTITINDSTEIEKLLRQAFCFSCFKEQIRLHNSRHILRLENELKSLEKSIKNNRDKIRLLKKHSCDLL